MCSHEASIRVLAELGADLNASDDDGVTPAHEAAYCDHIEVIKVLVSLRVNIDLVFACGISPLVVAVRSHHRDTSVLLVNVGADVQQCWQYSSYAGVNPVREMMSQFCTRVGLPNSDGIIVKSDAFADLKCFLFSFTKLMWSAGLDLCGDNATAAAAVGDDDDDDDDDNDDVAHQLFETNIAVNMRHLLSPAVIVRMQEMQYVLKKRLVLISWRVYQSTLLLDGDRVSAVVKARRYTELVCFLFNLPMLTCKSNNERRRFPVCYVEYRELEANLIEEWVAYGSSRFVSTDIILAVMAIHEQYYISIMMLYAGLCYVQDVLVHPRSYITLLVL